MSPVVRRPALALVALLAASPALAQMPGGGPPAVGTITARPQAITETTEINGRIQAIGRVDLTARVNAYLQEQLFVEGAEVKKGDLLFRLEQPPFEADAEAKRAAVDQAQAQLDYADLALGRAEQLLKTSSGSQSTADNARAAQRTAAAQLRSAQAQLRQSEINLGYTEIRSPIDGRIGRIQVTLGNVVGPSSGALATVVSQDPAYVVFPISVNRLLQLREEFAAQGGLEAMKIRLRLPDGRLYREVGKLQFVDVAVARDTDSIILRGTIANPPLAGGGRELTHDEMVRVLLEGSKPREVLAIPRAAILTDQQGDYVYVVSDKNVAERRRVKLGQSTAQIASVIDGLKAGDQVIVEGVQRARPNAPVTPTPAAATTALPTPR
ncbi:efflux RND transporter periplasmic adaptor subunit [Rhodopseudomonas palustris]|uniref:Efflux RND transporter periplasmic adaptor subunit n=1 Tax=Rhodopseudomonas palustris (strain ATCC BAA-98 / CGA009) TaxID=258594 RepID=Q6NDL0_RHOPA|nr:efflux RND transporter periplasmic adaptor subunit [Rhodopseudomonas palustris]OPF97417.1 efflux transporter periplasmic adaptor subunit [Rhodopseudomonas palustris]PPQ43327.1 efflux RND transporter periplasmic adaptor subunit [Rhodopseudomonas palustris]RJF67694.1 efflux RND transporter periplasmic adaptor subunit [Rhodopseudomonas palustris]WAB77816.1 efflux RND transporter periplasmic adaptor subunit [Rhodopseudomonas palustris]WCL90220.1 efflux RND transporter periplasmic adaptor subuni